MDNYPTLVCHFLLIPEPTAHYTFFLYATRFLTSRASDFRKFLAVFLDFANISALESRIVEKPVSNYLIVTLSLILGNPDSNSRLNPKMGLLRKEMCSGSLPHYLAETCET